MTKTLRVLVAACLLFAFEGDAQTCKQTPETKKTGHRKISAQEAKKMLDENPQALLLDVRTEAEFKEKRIPGAVLLPSDEVKKKAKVLLPKKEALILVYCRSGRRSAKAARELVVMGYTNIYDFGGLNSWPYATEKDETPNRPM